ncbi:hypothetical protein [Clostridium saccharoperbutylacetonicum]|uniref:hypothetical protein n=1 Tax=Clostridium saccharoperbutylacetonicum TaxID=36745 RepID=UPI000983B65F|nr:hypothetical protein [Clostridium saccharoperbutylacetonicum]AQR95545.1 hypothetical protein CLSAP_28610 [Clostridium saccharoperbutylacetonicum]NSB31405.1 putative amidophosphoribosyltransferase [Clostridium saccharoperbutylacetonicum]
MSNLIKCECCNADISDESKCCIHCGQPINNEELSFDYLYNGKRLLPIRYSDTLKKIQLLKETGNVEVFDKNYKVKNIICSAHNNTVDVILDDYEE